MLRLLELVFVFFSKIYVFFYKDKGDYWKIFPCIIISTIFMINIEMTISFFPSLEAYSTWILPLFLLLFFWNFFYKKEYNWVVQYPLSKKQKTIIVSVLVVDFIIVVILTEISRNIYIAKHGIGY